MTKLFYTPNDTIGSCDSESIQNAVDKALETGVMNVRIPRVNDRTGKPEWVITEGIRLPSGMCVTLDNCFMIMADDVMSNFFVSANAYTPDAYDPEKRMHDITIRGIGRAELNGGKPNELNESTQLKDGFPIVTRNSPIFMINVEGFRVENISITHQRYWGMRFEFCSKGIIRDIFTLALVDRRNQDGLNLRNGCHDILIENVHGQTGDDTIALSAIDVKREHEGNMIVEGMSWDIHDVVIRNISGAAINHPLVALRNHNGAKIYNITIEDICDTEMLEYPAKWGQLVRYATIRVGNNGYIAEKPSKMGDTYNIKINNVYTNYSARVVAVQATMKNVSITNVHAGGKCRSVVSTGPVWSDAPCGVQIDGLTVENVHFECESREDSCVFDFAEMREDDFVRGAKVKGAELRNVGALAAVAQKCGEVDISASDVCFKY